MKNGESKICDVTIRELWRGFESDTPETATDWDWNWMETPEGGGQIKSAVVACMHACILGTDTIHPHPPVLSHLA